MSWFRFFSERPMRSYTSALRSRVASMASFRPRAVMTASVVRASDGCGTRRTSLSASSRSMRFVTVAGGMRSVLLIQLSVSDDSGSVASHVSTS